VSEVLVAIQIVGLMAVSLFGCFFSGFAILQRGRENLRATQIMLQRIEAIRLFTWQQVLDTTNYLRPTFVDCLIDFPSGGVWKFKAPVFNGEAVRGSLPLLSTEYGKVRLGEAEAIADPTGRFRELPAYRQFSSTRLHF